ncbi:DUF6153 family protein [Actinoplanes palleronii]|uniref:DUF6153 family protein n=1 Tax=Actinoplanes palleronii TaxID=113570 RepID=UPI001940F891|nr:DUF6153 family protein [Actinoplanes palleronii]
MTSTTAATIGRTARTVLVLCTVFGLATMHTLGHAGVRAEHPGTAAMTTVSAATALTGASFVAAPAAETCPDDHCTGHHDHDQMSVWSVCLAILGGLTVIVLLALALLAGARPDLRPRGAGASRRPATRAPPIAGAGLTLASTAVLRI